MLKSDLQMEEAEMKELLICFRPIAEGTKRKEDGMPLEGASWNKKV